MATLVKRLRERAHLLGDHRNESVVDDPLLTEAATRVSDLEHLLREALECGAFDDAPLLLEDVRAALRATDSKSNASDVKE